MFQGAIAQATMVALTMDRPVNYVLRDSEASLFRPIGRAAGLDGLPALLKSSDSSFNGGLI